MRRGLCPLNNFQEFPVAAYPRPASWKFASEPPNFSEVALEVHPTLATARVLSHYETISEGKHGQKDTPTSPNTGLWVSQYVEGLGATSLPLAHWRDCLRIGKGVNKLFVCVFVSAHPLMGKSKTDKQNFQKVPGQSWEILLPNYAWDVPGIEFFISRVVLS